jgi:ketol-acid reductoisomerase
MKIALLGAGGKMGVRLATNLKGSRFDVAHVEISEAGQKRLKEALDVNCVPRDEALAGAKAVILAVPDTAIGAVARSIVDKLEPGAMVIALDAAAPFAGHLPDRDDITYFVTHPCHPPDRCLSSSAAVPSAADPDRLYRSLAAFRQDAHGVPRLP